MAAKKPNAVHWLGVAIIGLHWCILWFKPSPIFAEWAIGCLVSMTVLTATAFSKIKDGENESVSVLFMCTWGIWLLTLLAGGWTGGQPSSVYNDDYAMHRQEMQYRDTKLSNKPVQQEV